MQKVTFDNGKEFAEHQHMDKELQSNTYFADPFASRHRFQTKTSIDYLGYVPQKSDHCLH